MVKIFCNGVIFPQIRAIFFDKDGTLEDSRLFLVRLAEERIKQVASEVPQIGDDLWSVLGIENRNLNPKGLMAVGSREENEIAIAAFVASCGYDWFAAKEIVRQAFDQAGATIVPTKDNSPMFPGSLEVIKSLVAAKVKLGIISADSTAGIKAFVEREQISNYFQILLGSDFNLSKPDPLLYLKACKLFNVLPEQTLMVGDSLGDIAMAKQANARGTLGISWHNLEINYLDRATVVIDNLNAIKVLSS